MLNLVNFDSANCRGAYQSELAGVHSRVSARQAELGGVEADEDEATAQAPSPTLNKVNIFSSLSLLSLSDLDIAQEFF